MGVRGIVNAGGGAVTALTARVTTLENVQNEYEIYISIASGTSGTATIPTGSSIVAAQYGTANGLVVQVDATGKPTDIAARTAAGAVVTVTLNTGTGAYTLSGTPSAYPVALVYQVLCSAKDAANIPVASIIDWTIAKGTMSTQNADAVAITGGTAALSTLTTTGSVGIGTSSPSEELHITSAIPTIQLQDSDDNSYAQVLYNTGSGGLLLRADQGASAASASNIIMQVDGTERLRIDSTGNVGVGTSSPESHLDVTGTNGILISANKTDATGKTGRLRFKHYLNAEEPITGLICPSSASATSLFVGGGSGSENAVGLIKFYTAADNVTVSGTERMVIDGSGNVGIGTTSPASRFHIAMDDSVGGINTILRVANLNATRYTSAMSFTSSPGNDWKIGKGAFSNDQDFAIGLLSGTELLRLNTSGNIGIGTVTPGQKLSVVGTIESTSGGFKFPDGTIQTTASAGGGGGGVTVKTSTINVASGVYQQYTTSIVDASVSTSSNLNAWLAPNTDWDADDLIGYDVRLTPQTGSIDVCISAPGPIVGDFSLKYFIA